MTSEPKLPLERIVVRNALAHQTWLVLRLENVLPHDRYTSETLSDLAASIDHDECLATADRFSDAVLSWLGAQELLTSGSDEQHARQLARSAWAEINDYLTRPLAPPTLDEETVQAAADALVYYVHAWNLPLNPENLEEMAYAMLARLGLESRSRDG